MSFEPITIILKSPVEHAGKIITEIPFTRPLKGKDLKGIPMNEMCFEHIFQIAGRLTGYPPSVIEELEGADIGAVGEVVANFLSDSP